MAGHDRPSSVKVGVVALALAAVVAMITATTLFDHEGNQRRKQETQQTELFGGLSVTLHVASSVRSGDELASTLRVENRSGHAVTDPGCELAATRSGIVPVGDPDAELWLVVEIDCQGPTTYEPGFTAEYTGPSFFARTRRGDPLAPGQYLAATQWPAGKRLEYPVTVVER